MLIGFEFTVVEHSDERKVFVPLDKIEYIEQRYKKEPITGAVEGIEEGCMVHLTGRRFSFVVKEDYTDILEKWLNNTNEHPGVFDLSN